MLCVAVFQKIDIFYSYVYCHPIPQGPNRHSKVGDCATAMASSVSKPQSVLSILTKLTGNVPHVAEHILHIEARLKSQDVLSQYNTINKNYDEALQHYTHDFYREFRSQDPNPYFSVRPEFYGYLRNVKASCHKHPLHSSIMNMLCVIVSSLSSLTESDAFYSAVVMATNDSFFRKFAAIVVLSALLQQSVDAKQQMAPMQEELGIAWGPLTEN